MAALLPVIACGGGAFHFWSKFNQAIAKRDALIAAIAGKGEPVTGDDLAKWAGVPEGTPDLTPRYQVILSHYSEQTNLSPEEERLPIIGPKATGNVPALSEPWPDQAVAENYLANRPWLDVAEELADVAGAVCFGRDYSTGIDVRLDDVQAMRSLTRDLQLRFSVRMRSADRAGALRSLRGIFRLSNALAQEPLLVGHLVRLALHGVGVQVASEFLRDGKATPDEIGAIREMLHNDFRAGLDHCLKGERASNLISLRAYSFQEIREKDDDFNPSKGEFPIDGKVADLCPDDTAMLLEFYRESIDIVERNEFPAIAKGLTDVETKLQQVGKDVRSAMIWNKHFITYLMLPATGALGTAFARTTAKELALKAALDVEEKLITLRPGERTQEAELAAIVEVLPTDPFTGQPMKYVIDEEGYKIYTVGSDGVDEKGPSDDLTIKGRKIKNFGVWVKRRLAEPAQK